MSNPIQQATEPSPGPYQKWFGVYPGVVVETRDDRPGWVKVQLQWALPDNFGGKKASGIILWARLGSPYAGSGTGVFFLPEIGDEIIVAFCGGEPSRAYVLGAVWSNASPNPGSGNADTKVIQTRSGNEIAFQDTDGDSGISIQTQNGTSVVLKDAGGGSIKITTDSGTSIHIDAGGITLDTGSKVELNASALEINSGILTVNAGMSHFKGAVRCDTLLANSVVASSYTPGAGNIW